MMPSGQIGTSLPAAASWYTPQIYYIFQTYSIYDGSHESGFIMKI